MDNRIGIINDISALGNCSMVANISVFSAMGFQCCPIPTALLTNQSCYEVYYNQKVAVDFHSYSKAWKKNGFDFEKLYSGYFANGRQIADFIKEMLVGDKLYINDPVMGDNGKEYDNFSKSMLDEMKKAVARSFVTTPNLTELCLLTGKSYEKLGKITDREEFFDTIVGMAKSLVKSGAKNVVVTGVRDIQENKEKKLYNIVCSARDAAFIKNELIDGDFSGTGDIFSSVLGALVMGGHGVDTSTAKAAKFMTKIIKSAVDKGVENVNDGINFYEHLSELEGKDSEKSGKRSK